MHRPATPDAAAAPAPPRPGRSPRIVARWRRLALAAAVVAALALAGTACSDDGGGDASDTSVPAETTTTVVGTTSLEQVEISVDTTTAPTVAFQPSYVPAGRESRVVVEGTGAPLEDGQWAQVNFVAISGADGSELESSWAGGPQTLPISAEQLDQAFVDDLVGLPIGSRLAVAQEGPVGWVILVMDVVGTLPKEASGTEVPPVAGLPTVTMGDAGPTIAMPGGDAPTELVVQPLIEGTGPPVEAGQTITVMYTGAIYGSGTVFDSSWERGAPVQFDIGAGRVIPGWDEGLVGQPVGSRVLLVIPPDKGYGAEGNPQAGIAGTDTLVFVVDILAAS